MGHAYGLLLSITSSCGLREKLVVYRFSLLIIVWLLLPLYLYYSSVCCLRLWVGTVPRVLIGKYSDRNPASDPPFFPVRESVLLPKADEITVWATQTGPGLIGAPIAASLNRSANVYSHFRWFSRMRHQSGWNLLQWAELPAVFWMGIMVRGCACLKHHCTNVLDHNTTGNIRRSWILLTGRRERNTWWRMRLPLFYFSLTVNKSHERTTL